MKRLSFTFIILIIFSSCLNRNPSEIEYTQNDRGLVLNDMLRGEAPLNYASFRKYILKPKCMSCHSGENAKPKNDPIDFSTYETAMIERFVPLLIKGKPEVSRLYQVVENSEMPIRGSLHQRELDFIKQWIELCAPKEELSEIPTTCVSDDDDDDDWDDD